MRNARLIVATVLALAPLACTRVMEDDVIPVNQSISSNLKKEIVVGRRMNATTKVTISDADGSFSWSLGKDDVAFHTTEGWVITREGASSNPVAADFELAYSASASRDAFAVFPLSLVCSDPGSDMASSVFIPESVDNYGQEGHGLCLSLPSSYDLNDVAGESVPCPMIALNTNSSWGFYQLCGLLRLTVGTLPPDAYTLKVDFNGQKVCGLFTLDAPVKADGTSYIQSIPTESSDDQIVIQGIQGQDGIIINIPLPAGSYHSITLVAYNEQGVPVKAEHLPFEKSIAAARGVKKECPVFTKGIFSVAEGKYIMIAPGDLQYQASTKKWRFASPQYSYIGGAPGNSTLEGRDTQEDWIDKFGWGSSGWDHSLEDPLWIHFHPYDTSSIGFKKDGVFVGYGYGPTYQEGSNNSLEGVNRNGDWGVYNAIESDVPGTWRTPTASDWNYLFRGEARTTIRFEKAKVNGMAGVIIFPDNYVHPEGVVKLRNTNDETFKFLDSPKCQDFAPQNWALMEAAGAVFLPASGYRNGPKAGVRCPVTVYYWSSTVGTTHPYYAYSVYITNVHLAANSQNAKFYGFSVRLVKDID